MTPFSATLASEWTKLTSRRATYVTTGLGVVLAMALTAVVCIVIGATWDDWKPADRADFDATSTPLIGGIFTAILFAIVGVKAVSTEYASGMMRLTLTATPRRGRVLAAKALAVSAVTLVAGTVATLAMFLCGQAIFGAYGLDTASLAEWDALRLVLGSSMLSPALPLIGAALAFMVRSAAGAITTVLGFMFLPAIIGALLPRWWEENVLAYLPGQAAESITSSHLADSPDYLIAPGVGIVVLAAWLAAFLGAAYVVFNTRDA